MLIMPLLCRYRVFRYSPMVNFALMLAVPYIFEVALHMIPSYENITLIHDLFSCFLYFPCFLVGYWMAENQIIEKTKGFGWLHSPILCTLGIAIIFLARIFIRSIAGFSLDVFYAPMLICLAANFFERVNCRTVVVTFNILGKYSTGIWFFQFPELEYRRE